MEQDFGTAAVVQVSWVEADLEQMTLRIHQHVPLAARDLLATTGAARSTGLGGAHRLAVDDGRRRLGCAPTPDPLAFAERGVNLLSGASSSPSGIVPADGRPGWTFVRYGPPLAAGAQEVEDRLDNPPQIEPLGTRPACRLGVRSGRRIDYSASLRSEG